MFWNIHRVIREYIAENYSEQISLQGKREIPKIYMKYFLRTSGKVITI